VFSSELARAFIFPAVITLATGTTWYAGLFGDANKIYAITAICACVWFVLNGSLSFLTLYQKLSWKGKIQVSIEFAIGTIENSNSVAFIQPRILLNNKSDHKLKYKIANVKTIMNGKTVKNETKPAKEICTINSGGNVIFFGTRVQDIGVLTDDDRGVLEFSIFYGKGNLSFEEKFKYTLTPGFDQNWKFITLFAFETD
jgi:hypothetical protein